MAEGQQEFYLHPNGLETQDLSGPRRGYTSEGSPQGAYIQMFKRLIFFQLQNKS